MKNCQHPNIIKLYDIYESETYFIMILEYCKGGNLYSYMKMKYFRLKESTVVNIIHKLCTVVFYLQNFGIIHRDIKPQNITLTDISENPDIRLIDFGLAKIVSCNDFANDPYGTLYYSAPELLLKQPYNFAVDLWSIGILTYYLLCGNLPFDSNNERNIRNKIIQEPITFKEKRWNSVSLESKDFIERLLKKESIERMNIKQALQHKWLSKFASQEQKNILLKRQMKNLDEINEFKIYSLSEDKKD